MKTKAALALASILALSSAITADAKPARRGAVTVAQPDGTELTLSRIGDERFHAYVTPDGKLMRQDADGTFRYVTRNGVISSVDDMAPATTADFDNLAARAPRSAANTVDRPLRGDVRVPMAGKRPIPVILVQFSDVKFKDADPMATFTKFFQEGDKSCHQYFVDQSNGLYQPQFDLYGPYQLSKRRTSYGGNDRWGNDQGLGAMVAEAVKGLDSTIDFSKYDTNGDGDVDAVIFLYAGVGEADSDLASSIWPCCWDLYSSDYGRAITQDGVVINDFAVFNELYGPDKTKIDGIGTFAHEFSHCLGLPDYYCTSGISPAPFGMDSWSLMDYGCYADDGYTPIGYSAYEKEYVGWLEVPEGVADTHYTLAPLNQGNDMALKLTNDADPYEFFVLESRTKKGWDAYLEGNGMLITHVTFDQYAWDTNSVNNNSNLQRVTPVPADNKLTTKTLAGDLWPNGNVDEFTDSSTPAAKTNRGGYLSKPVTEIKRDSKTGDVSFWLMKGEGATSVSFGETTAAEGSAAWFDLQGHALSTEPAAAGIYLRRNASGRVAKVIK